MQRKTYPKDTAAQLLDELTARLGGDPRRFVVGKNEDGDTVITVPDDVDMTIVDQVVDAHNPLIYKQVDDRRATRAAADRLVILNFAKSTTAPSPAQVLAFQKALARDHLRVLGQLRDEDDT